MRLSRGLIDNVSKIKKILETKKINHYVHADAAIDGMVLPFINTDILYRLSDGIDSLSISGHKIIGAPMPCGIVLANKNFQSKNLVNGYVNIKDNTVSGSRNGFTVSMLWYAIKQKGFFGFKELIEQCLKKAETY